MATYTLHLNEGALPGEAGALEDAVLVRDGFSWTAFLFTALWFFVNRLWLVGLGVLLLLVALNGLMTWLGIDPFAAFLAQLALSLLIGFEAASLKRWTLHRRRRPAVDAVVADSREEAETKAFTRWLEMSPSPSSAATATALRPYQGDAVLGLFPSAEPRR